MVTLFYDEISTQHIERRTDVRKPSMKAVVFFIVLVAALLGAGLLDSEALKQGWIK